jgi:hypothetical protein
MSVSDNLKSKSSWLRGLYILLFALLYSIAEVVLWAIVLFQFGSQLLVAHPNPRLLAFSRGLTAYIYLILQYLTYRSDDKPYPFDEWPSAGPCDEATPESGTPADEDEAPPATTTERDDEGETESGV